MLPTEPAKQLIVLKAFFDAWNDHDVDGLMNCMTEDCVFETAIGPHAFGARHVGAAQVRQAFEVAWAAVPDARWRIMRHLPCGDVVVSQWEFSGTGQDGTPIRLDGCDILTFRGEKIAVKNAFRKQPTK